MCLETVRICRCGCNLGETVNQKQPLSTDSFRPPASAATRTSSPQALTATTGPLRRIRTIRTSRGTSALVRAASTGTTTAATTSGLSVLCEGQTNSAAYRNGQDVRCPSAAWSESWRTHQCALRCGSILWWISTLKWNGGLDSREGFWYNARHENQARFLPQQACRGKGRRFRQDRDGKRSVWKSTSSSILGVRRSTFSRHIVSQGLTRSNRKQGGFARSAIRSGRLWSWTASSRSTRMNPAFLSSA